MSLVLRREMLFGVLTGLMLGTLTAIFIAW
jgi:hypothetical protein